MDELNEQEFTVPREESMLLDGLMSFDESPRNSTEVVEQKQRRQTTLSNEMTILKSLSSLPVEDIEFHMPMPKDRKLDRRQTISLGDIYMRHSTSDMLNQYDKISSHYSIEIGNT